MIGTVTSCRISSKLGQSSRWETLVFWLVKKLSRHMTSWPSATESLAKMGAQKAGAAGDQNAMLGIHESFLAVP